MCVRVCVCVHVRVRVSMDRYMWMCFFSSSNRFHTYGCSRSFCLRKHVPSNEMVSIQHNKALGDCVFRTMMFLLLLLVVVVVLLLLMLLLPYAISLLFPSIPVATLPCHSLFTFDSQISVHFRPFDSNQIRYGG